MFQHKIRTAFALMRKKGLIARQNFLCCMSCGCAQLASDWDAMLPQKRAKVMGYVFYHRQDAQKLKRCKEFHVCYGKLATDGTQEESPLSSVEVGRLVAQCFIDAGLDVEWNGTDEQRICCKERNVQCVQN